MDSLNLYQGILVHVHVMLVLHTALISAALAATETGSMYPSANQSIWFDSISVFVQHHWTGHIRQSSIPKVPGSVLCCLSSGIANQSLSYTSQ